MSKPAESSIRTFASLLQPLSAQPKTEIGGKKLVGRAAAEMEELKRAATAEGYAEGQVKGHDAGYELGYQEGRKEGFDDGRDAGFKQAYEEAAAKTDAEFAVLQAALNGVMESIPRALAEWFEKSEPALAQLAVLIASRLVAKELSLGPEAILSTVQEALAEVTHSTSARVRLNPFQAPILEKHRQQILAVTSSVREIEVVEDPTIPGGCVIESDGGVVDTRLDEKIAEVLAQMRRAA